MLVTRLSSLFGGGLELVAAIVLVLLFFCILLIAMNSIFPSGTPLKGLMSGTGDGQDFLGVQGDRESDLTAAQPGDAILRSVQNRVKSKRADRIAWTPASEGMPLHNRDAVQTLSRSSAHIEFDAQNHLDLRENSLVIIKRLEKDPLFKEKRSFLVILDGELRGRLETTEEESVHVEVTTPSAVARISTTDTAGGKSDFNVTVHPDMSSTIAVYEGTAEVTAQGAQVRIESNQYSRIALGQAPSSPETMQEPLELISPEHGTVFVYRNLRPKIRFQWNRRPDGEGYRLTVAKDPKMLDKIFEETLVQTEFTHGNLPQGTYYWRVTPGNADSESALDGVRSLEVVQDLKIPSLNVDFPPGTLTAEQYRLTGEAEQGTQVFVMGRRILTNRAGRFEYDLALRPGTNVIVVEAVDTAGNIAYRSKLVNAKY